jgi:heparosan-N-sulfate-glucuronate 5-epimerase
VPVEREIKGIKQSLKPGWVSAMGQGHALNVLTRAYHLTKDRRYVDAALKALHVFEMEAVDGGVRNHLFGLTWFEE